MEDRHDFKKLFNGQIRWELKWEMMGVEGRPHGIYDHWNCHSERDKRWLSDRKAAEI